SRDALPLQPACVHRDPEQQRRIPRRRSEYYRRTRSIAPGVREGRALRKTDGGLWWGGGFGHHAGRAAQRDARSDALGQAYSDQRGHRRESGHGKRPHHESQSRREEETMTAIRVGVALSRERRTEALSPRRRCSVAF